MKLTKESLKKSQLCPPGMHPMTLVAVEDSYLKENGCEVQKVDFETAAGHLLSVWFNSAVQGNFIEFIQAADGVTFKIEDFEDMDIPLKDYIGRQVIGDVTHGKYNGKPVANIDHFYPADSVPF